MDSPQRRGIMVAGHSGDSEALKHQGIASGCFLRLLSFGSVNASTTRIERAKLSISRPEAIPLHSRADGKFDRYRRQSCGVDHDVELDFLVAAQHQRPDLQWVKIN